MSAMSDYHQRVTSIVTVVLIPHDDDPHKMTASGPCGSAPPLVSIFRWHSGKTEVSFGQRGLSRDAGMPSGVWLTGLVLAYRREVLAVARPWLARGLAAIPDEDFVQLDLACVVSGRKNAWAGSMPAELQKIGEVLFLDENDQPVSP